jgi:hypothetical protein
MDDLIIRQKLEDMIQYAHVCLRRFPKAERHALGADIERATYSALRLTITANKRYYKKTTTQELDVEMEIVKSLVRLAKDLGFLPLKQYELWQTRNVEIGKLIGGWLKGQRSAG